jgi:hypothetical protein
MQLFWWGSTPEPACPSVGKSLEAQDPGGLGKSIMAPGISSGCPAQLRIWRRWLQDVCEPDQAPCIGYFNTACFLRRPLSP